MLVLLVHAIMAKVKIISMLRLLAKVKIISMLRLLLRLVLRLRVVRRLLGSRVHRRAKRCRVGEGWV